MATTEKRMKALLNASDLFISGTDLTCVFMLFCGCMVVTSNSCFAEMTLIYNVAERSSIFHMMHSNLPSFSVINYGMVFALNINTFLSPMSLQSPFMSLVSHLTGKQVLNGSERLSLLATSGFVAIVMFGYAMIVLTIGVVEIPLTIKKIDKLALDSNLDDEKKEIGVTPLTLLYGTLATGLFIGLHAINFKLSISLYAAVAAIVNGPQILGVLRKRIGYRFSSKLFRKYAIVYDCYTQRSFIRNYSMLFICCFLVRLFRCSVDPTLLPCLLIGLLLQC